MVLIDVLGSILRRRRDPTETFAELDSNEEQVVQLLSENGGRLWQEDVETKTGWSKSKTSEVFSAMETEGKIDRDRRGREKIVLLPGTESDSPIEP